MAEYIYKAMANEQGWGATFNATGRFPIIGSRIFPTLTDLNTFIGGANSTAIAGVMCGVVNDGTNNGLYQISFIDTTLTETFVRDGQTITNVKCYDDVNDKTNLKAVKVINADEQGCITGGAIVDGFYATISGVERFVYQRVNQTGEYEYYYIDDQGQQHSYTYKSETLHTYISMSLTNGDKIFINADELKGVSDTHVDYGTIRTSGNNTYIDLYWNGTPHTEQADVSIDISSLTYSNSVVEYNPSTDTLTATTGLFNNEAMQVIERYIDNFDCGTY